MITNDLEFRIFVAILIFIVVVLVIAVVTFLANKYMSATDFKNTILDLRGLSSRMSRDKNVHKQYIYDLDQCIRILEQYK